MTKSDVWNREFEAAKAQGLPPARASQVADVKAQEWASAQHFAAASRALAEAVAYHALSVRDNVIDRRWAARLSGGPLSAVPVV